MAKSERGRYWQFEVKDFKFRYRFFRGLNFTLARTPFHFNPAIPFSAWRNPPEIMLIAGGWGVLTNILTALQAKTLSRSTLCFWSESHTNSSRHKNWLVDQLRSLCIAMYGRFAVPGEYALDYVRRHAPNGSIYFLPNTVDESLFRDRVLTYRASKDEIRAELNVPKENRVLLLPARLMPEKGVTPFLNVVASLSPSLTNKLTLLIAGDGPLKQQLNSWVSRYPSLDVRLLGHAAESEMVKLYAVADSFVLPSLGDPNPLSVIEALWAELPLILSDRVGNHLETLRPNENGWLFNPGCADAAREVLEKWMNASDSELERLGRFSLKIANEKFETENVVNYFLDEILSETSISQISHSHEPAYSKRV
jgi:glycosyltransferase involved in cell wall biosynthesis